MKNDQCENEKIAIVMATYNPREDFFRKQIDSIKAQTWSNWICFIADDNSEPQNKRFIQNLVANDSRFVCYFFENNLGSYYNFERGLECCKGQDLKGIAFCDQDDIWMPEKLELLIRSMRSSNAVMIHSDLKLINQSDMVIGNSCWEYEGRSVLSTNYESLLFKNTITGCAMLFSASILSEILPFPKQARTLWHHDRWVAIVALTLGDVIHFNEPLVLYRQHENNTLGAIKPSRELTNEVKAWKSNKFRITGNSYLNLSGLIDQFYTRCLPNKKNPFSLDVYDFGFGILWLGFKNYLKGNGQLGATLRLCVLKNILTFQKVFD